MKTRFDIGEITYHNGDEIRITGDPYTLYGAEWQDGIDTDHNTPATVLTPRQRQWDVERKRAEWAATQKQFTRLNAKD